MYHEAIKLIKTTQEPDETGELISTTVEREIFAKMVSIGQQEFYQAQANGLKPELKFEIADYLDYDFSSKQKSFQASNKATLNRLLPFHPTSPKKQSK